MNSVELNKYFRKSWTRQMEIIAFYLHCRSIPQIESYLLKLFFCDVNVKKTALHIDFNTLLAFGFEMVST